VQLPTQSLDPPRVQARRNLAERSQPTTQLDATPPTHKLPRSTIEQTFYAPRRALPCPAASHAMRESCTGVMPMTVV